MNRHSSDRDYDRHEGGFHTHRSERYRHPDQDSGYRFDDYGSAAHGGYGNESYQGTWGNQGNERGGSRNYSRTNITDEYGFKDFKAMMSAYLPDWREREARARAVILRPNPTAREM